MGTLRTARRILTNGPTEAEAAFIGIFLVTGLGLVSIGATLPVLPRYVEGPLGGSDFAVGLVTGAFAATGLAFRPIGGNLADSRGRKPVVIVGAVLSTIAGLLYFVDAGIGGLVVARLFLGAGEGMVYTAGAAWVVDLAPANRRGEIIGIYGLAIWAGLSLGPPIGELLLRVSSFEMVWAFAAAAPALGAIIATRLPEPRQVLREAGQKGGFISREALGPGLGLALAVVGFAALSAFIVLHLEEQGIGGGGAVFTAFAATVFLARLVGSNLPDRIGPARTAALMAGIEACGLVAIALAETLWLTLAGAVAMGAGFSLLFPSLAVMVVNRVSEERRGVAMGTFTAFFDLGVGVGAPLTGVAASIGGYEAAFWVAAAAAMASLILTLVLNRKAPAEPAGVGA